MAGITRRRRVGAAALLAGAVPPVTSVDLLVSTHAAWATAAFQKAAKPSLTPTSLVSCNSQTHRYASEQISQKYGSKQWSGTRERLPEPTSAALGGVTGISYHAINQETWVDTHFKSGQPVSWAEAGFKLGELSEPWQSSTQGIFYARRNHSKGYAIWWFPNMPRAIASSSWWDIKIVDHSATRHRYDLYAYQYSHGGKVLHSNVNYVAGFSSFGTTYDNFGIETTCWNSRTWWHGNGPANGGNGQGGNGESISLKSGGTWHHPTTSKDWFNGPYHQAPCHVSWWHANYKISVRESKT